LASAKNLAKLTIKKEIRDRFIAALRKHRSITKACESIGKSRTIAYQWREKFPDFRQAWDEAVETNIDDLEAGAMRRAIEGTLEPIYYKGKPVGVVRKYETALTIFMLKKNRTRKYDDRHDEGTEEFDKDETFL